MKKRLCALLIFAAAGSINGMEVEKTDHQDLSDFSIELLRDYIKYNNPGGITVVLAHAKNLDRNKVVEALSHSIALASVKIFSEFLNWGIDTNKPLGFTQDTLATTIASTANQYPEALEKLQMLINNTQTDLTFKNRYGHTPIMCASQQGNHQCLELLLQSRANATKDEQDTIGRTALMLAASTGSLECVQLLIDAGATIDIQDHKKNTALGYAINKTLVANKIAKFLINNGADVNIKSSYGGTTPLMLAVVHHQPLDMEWIKKADLNIQNAHGKTVLMLAIKNIKMNPYYSNAKLIIANNADVTLKDHQGRTALDIAQQILDETKKEIRTQERTGYVPNIEIYTDLRNYTEIVELLKQRESGTPAIEIAKQIRSRIVSRISEIGEYQAELQAYDELIEILQQQR